MRLAADEARRRFAGEPVARLATIRADGSPHIVPIVFAVEPNRIVTAVDAKPKSSDALVRLRNIEIHPAISVLVDVYADDWARLWWARADGRADVVASGPQHAKAVEALRAKYAQYADPASAFGAAIIVTVERWVGWAASG